MLTQSKEVQNAWRASQRTLDIKVTIDGKTYGATDINSLKYDSGAYNGDTFAIGSTYSNTVQIEFSHLIEGLKLGMEVRPSIGIKTSSGYVYEPLGVFIISSEIKMDRNNNLTTVSASDRFCGLEGGYVSKLTYPAKVLDVIAEVCAQSGVKANTDDLARLPHQADLPAPITGQSYRKVLGWIAQLYVGYAQFDRQGLFTIRTISEPNYELDPSQYEQAGLTKNEAAYKINGIQCQVTITTKTRDGESTEETKTYQAGDATGSQIKLENNIMTPQRLNDIWEQLKDLTFYPFSLNWFGNPAVEAGDWLRLEDKQENSFVVPNSSYTLDFNGGLSATSKADQTTSSDQMVPWQGNVAQTIKELKIRRSPDGTVVFPPSVTEPPANAKFNDVWFKKNGNSTELWIFEKQDDGSGKWIRKDLSDDEIKKKVADAQQGINQAKVDIISNKQKADADIENLNKSIEDNKKVADESLQKLNDSVTNLQGQYDNNVVPNLNKVMADASDALQKYISAQNSIADLTKQAQEQGKDIANVTNTVKGLNINYANLAGDVNSTKVDVKGLQTIVGTANGDIAQLKLDAQNLQMMLAGKVDNTTYTNFVNLTNQALNARLTASDLNGYAKTADMQATANGLRVDLNSVTDRMNNLKASTRNLLFNTEDFQNYGVNGNAKIENISTLTSVPNHPEIIKIAHGWGDYQSAYSDQYVTLEKDKIYWFGFYVCTDNTTQSPYNTMAVYANENNSVANAKCWAYVNTQDYSYYGGKAQNWTWHIYKIIGDGKTYHYWRAEPSNHVQSSYYAAGYTLVQSDIAPTEHVNSPEDTKNSLEQLSARIMTNSQQFSSYYTKSETDTKTNAAKDDAVNAIKSDSNWTGLKNVLTNSGFLQTADGFLQKVQQTTVPMFNGGGINLVQGTSNRWSDSWWNGFNGGTNQTKEVGKFYLSSLNVGDWVTVVVNYQYQNISGNNPSIILQADGDKTGWDYEIFPGRSWQKLQTSSNLNFGAFKWSFQINENALKNTYLNLNFRVDNAKGGWLQWCNLKIEKGKIATPWSPAPNDLATQSAFSELSQSLEGLRSTVGSNYGNLQTQISQSASGIRTDLTNKITGLQTQLTTTANGLNAKIGAIQVGGRNLLHGTSDSWKSFTVSGWGLFSSASSTNTSTDGYKKGDQFTYSATIDNNGSHPVSLEAVAFDGNNNGSYNNSELIPAGSKNYRVKVTFAIQENTKYIRTSVMFPNASGANDTIRIKDEQLEEGNLCTQWTPNPDDISNQFTELNATINGLQSTVSSNHSDFQSQISQTAKTIRQEVSDKTNGLQTQINQQSNNFNVSLNSLRNETAWQKVTSAIDANNYKTTGNYWIQAAPNSNTPDSSAWAYLQVVAYPDVKRIKQTWQRDNNENEIYTRLLIGDNWTSWQRTVTGGNIMAQINMSAGATLIQNDKIYMDASSTIFSGNAFIPSAAITSLNADKITAGTINGAKVNVINLNANNITAGTLKGSNGEFYLDSGSLHVWQGDHNAWIDKNGIHDSDNSGNNVWISNGSISAYGNSSGAYLFDGGLYLHKSQSLSDAVLNPNYGSITKSDNIVSFGTSGLDIDGKDGFLLRTHGWNDQTLAYLNGNEIIGAGIAGKSDGFMNIAAKKQLFLYAGEPVQNDKLKTIPKLVLDGTYQNGQTALKGTFSQYFFQGPSSGFSGGITLQDEFVNVGSLNGKNYFSISNDGAISITANGKSILSLNGLFPGVNGDFNVSGNFTVTGSKNAVVPTSRGMAAINAYETAEYYFGDIGETQTNSNGVVTVMIDPYFLETVNTLVPYQVFLTPYGNGNVWVSSRSANNFTVKSSKPNIHFVWEIKAKRKGYENDRMKIVKGVFNNEQY